ncbi:MAG TPA: alpha/beta hydrolase-fold protein [Chloroflexia bacterium]|nr:alpha/beta hydrolase-fold protein [Chloroflexia bacterium]
MPDAETIESPRVAALAQALNAGDPRALAEFWQEVTAKGTPLIEEFGDAAGVRVTFLWRAEAPVERVALISRLNHQEAAENRLAHLSDTDLWYRTYTLPRDTRATYQFWLDDPLEPPGEDTDWAALVAAWRTDPLNPRTYRIPGNKDVPGDPDWTASVLEGPSAAPEPAIVLRPEGAAGRIEEHRIRSAILDNERAVWVYTPPGYRTDGEPYGLLVFFDGRLYQQAVSAPLILDNLAADGRIPPQVAVFIGNAGMAARDLELPCYPPMADFVVQELLPWVRERYHVTAEPARSLVAGLSYGALAAVFLAWRHPAIFGAVLAQSGSFWWHPDGDPEPEWLTRQLVHGSPEALRFYLEVGRFERQPNGEDGPSQLIATRHLRDVLQAKGYPVAYGEFSGGHDYLCWQHSLPGALEALLGGASKSAANTP